MKIDELIKKIESIYGKYENQNLKAIVIAFIAKKWNESEFDYIFSETVKQYPTQYKTQPDVAFFNKLWESSHSDEDEAEKAWNSLLSLRTSRCILCTDIVTQETLKSMGGIDEFVKYRTESNQWCHKDFIERYSRHMSKDFVGNAKPEIMINDFERMYPSYPRSSFLNNVKMIGDQRKGMQLLESIKSESLQLENKPETKQIGNVMKDFLKSME
jgi:hypothetical protein